MELRQLRYFLKVADLGSISKAAGQLFIAQSAISHQIAALEHALQTKLFIRGPGGVSLTEAGRLLYRHAQTITRQVQSAEDDVTAASGSPTGTVTVGVPNATVHVLAMPLLRAVRERYPGIRLHLLDGVSALLQEFALNGRLDFAVLFLAESAVGLEVKPILDEDLYFVAPVGTAWAADLGDEVELEATARHPLVVPGHGNSMRDVVERAFTRRGLPLEPVAELDSLTMLKGCVLEGVASTFLPWPVVGDEARQGRLKVARVRSRLFSRTVSVCNRDPRTMSLAAQAVHALLQEVAASLVRSGGWRGATLRDAAI